MPVTFMLPCIMWLRARQPGSGERALCLLITGGTGVIAALSLVGSVRNIAVLASEFSFWAD